MHPLLASRASLKIPRGRFLKKHLYLRAVIRITGFKDFMKAGWSYRTRDVSSGGSSGSSSVETCTVTVTENSSTVACVFYTSYTEGAYDYKTVRLGDMSYSLEDVVCGSLIVILYCTPMPVISLHGDVETVIPCTSVPGAARAYGILAPKTAGANGEISLTDDE